MSEVYKARGYTSVQPLLKKRKVNTHANEWTPLAGMVGGDERAIARCS